MFSEAAVVEYAGEIRGRAIGRTAERPYGESRGLTLFNVRGFEVGTPGLVECAVRAAPLAPSEEDAGGPDEQWDWLRRCLRQQPPQRRALVAQLVQAYEAATGSTVGCD
jgi:hypothetical protein